MTYGVDVGSAIAVGTDIYILGGESNGSRVCNCKFNTLTNTYTRMTDIPYDFMGCSAVAVNNDIYLFGLSNDKTYKYDISNNTYSSLTDMPYNFGFGSIVSVGNDVYIFGGQRRTNYCI